MIIMLLVWLISEMTSTRCHFVVYIERFV